MILSLRKKFMLVFAQDFATYENCQFTYGDDLSPDAGSNWTSLLPTDNCYTSVNITFNSTLIGQNRTALVFRWVERVNKNWWGEG